MKNLEDKMGNSTNIPLEKVAMAAIIMSLKDFNDPVALQSISDAALLRKKKIESDKQDNFPVD